MIDISGFGLTITIVAVQTFPMGFSVTQFSDDSDPLEIQDDEPGSFVMLYDGSLFSFTQANPILVKISVIAGTEDDLNLKILLGARRLVNSLLPIDDVTSMVINYPDGGKVLLSNGSILSGATADSITIDKRKRANIYTFVFGNSAGLQSPKQIISEVVQGGIGLL